MKKATLIKKTGIFALLAAMLLVMTACAPNIDGTWKLSGMEVNGVPAENTSSIQDMFTNGQIRLEITFKGGKYKGNFGLFTSDTVSGEGSYRLDGNQLILEREGEKTSFEFKLDGDKLELRTDGGVMFLSRQK